MRKPSLPDFSHIWVRPSFGLWFGGGESGSRDSDSGGGSGQGGMVIGGYEISLGLFAGASLGFGKKWGLYTGLLGAFALLPLLGTGFIGVPIGVHWRKKIGIGLIIPLQTTEWWVGLIFGSVLFSLTWFLKNRE